MPAGLRIESRKWAKRSHGRGACISCAISLSTASIAREAIDYAGYYAKGMTFAAFLDAATSHPDDWRKGYSNAAVTADTVSRLRALPARRLLLVVADDSAATRPRPCRTSHDSSTPRPTGSRCA